MPSDRFKIMNRKSFDKNGVAPAGIHWGQHVAMTLMSLMIFFIALDKSVPSFHDFALNLLFRLQCSGFDCNGVSL